MLWSIRFPCNCVVLSTEFTVLLIVSCGSDVPALLLKPEVYIFPHYKSFVYKIYWTVSKYSEYLSQIK